MIIARCPACQTVFRARPEQLSAHGGRVRCGNCLKPFNALENLVVDAPDHASSDLDDNADFDASTAHAEAAQTPFPDAGHEPQQPDLDAYFVFQEPPPDAPTRPSLSPWILEEKTTDTAAAPIPNAWPDLTTIDEAAQSSGEKHPSTFERMADRLDFVVPDEFLPSRPRVSEERRAATSDIHTPSLDGITGDVSRMEGPSRLALPVAASADASITREADANTFPNEREEASPFDTREGSVKEVTTRLPSDIDSTGSAVLRRRAPRLANTVTQGESSPEAMAAVQGESQSVRRYGDTQASPRRRWLMGLAIGILLGTLGAQVAYNFRVEITRNWPQLRPLYLELCAQLGCELPLPRVSAAIRITSSNLESDPTDSTRFVLNASIGNQARHPLAFPHLELTLTDARDRSIVRRVLGPDEWARGSDISTGLAAGEVIEISLAFSAPDLTDATGYRVYAFYP